MQFYRTYINELVAAQKNLHSIPIIGIFVKTLKIMAKNTSILLGEYFEILLTSR